MNNRNSKGIFYRLFFVAAIFFSIFVLSQLGDNFVAVGIAGVVVLIAGYLYFAQKEKEKQEEREHERMGLDRKLDEILNAQRAIYTITKRGNVKIEKELAATHEEIKEKLEKLVSAQERALSENRKFAEIQVNALKTLAKYNRENTRQLALNISKNADRLLGKLQNGSAGLQQGITETDERVEEADELWLGSEAAPSLETDSEQEQAVELESSTETDSEPEQAVELEPSMETDSESEQAVELEPSMEADSEPEQTVKPELAVEPIHEPEPVKEELPPPMPVVDDPNKKLSPDEIAALFASAGNGAGAQTAPEPEPIAEPEPSIAPIPSPEQISVPDLGQISIPDPEQIMIPDPEAIPVPPSMPAMDDPNKKMSPDDIEALIAALTPQE